MNVTGIFRSLFFVIFCSVALFFVGWNGLAEDAPPAVVEAAQSGLLPFLNHIPPGEAGHYGFAPGEQTEEAYPGIPFRLYTITPDALFNYGVGDTVSSLISTTDVWFFPVVLGGDYRAILTVGQEEGSWKAVAFGKAALARELQKVRRQWPASKGYDPELIAVFQATAYFFALPRKDDQNLTPLYFDGKGFATEFYRSDEGYRSTVKLPQIIEQLQEAVKENIRGQNY